MRIYIKNPKREEGTNNMNRNQLLKAAITILLLAIIIQIVYISYTIAQGETTTNDKTETATEQSVTYEISEEVQNKIQVDINIYRTFLVKHNVQQRFKEEIERLILSEYKLQEILIAYEFLSENFGKMEELEKLCQEKQSGKTWEQLFIAYNAEHGDFVPRAFDPDYLEELMHNSNISADDIMIADRVSNNSNTAYEIVIMYRANGLTWAKINEKLGILNSQSKLPRVQVTNEQIEQYTSGGLTENQVVEAFVIAKKISKSEEEIINKIKQGYSQEKIYAEYYQKIYN